MIFVFNTGPRRLSNNAIMFFATSTSFIRKIFIRKIFALFQLSTVDECLQPTKTCAELDSSTVFASFETDILRVSPVKIGI